MPRRWATRDLTDGHKWARWRAALAAALPQLRAAGVASPRVLVLGAGGGVLPLLALAEGAAHVTCAERCAVERGAMGGRRGRGSTIVCHSRAPVALLRLTLAQWVAGGIPLLRTAGARARAARPCAARAHALIRAPHHCPPATTHRRASWPSLAAACRDVLAANGAREGREFSVAAVRQYDELRLGAHLEEPAHLVVADLVDDGGRSWRRTRPSCTARRRSGWGVLVLPGHASPPGGARSLSMADI